MTVRPFRASIGLRRISAGIDVTQAASTRDTQDAMRKVVKNLNDFVKHMDEQIAEVIREALEPTFEKSQKYVPVDTGDLKESGFLVVERVKSGAFASIGYGLGGKPPYAVWVHEDLEARHKSPTRAKFLQSALEEDSSRIEQRIQRLLKHAGGL